MTTISTNGRGERKSLAGQLDRLDRILDGFADGLNEAVAQAVKETVSAAVEAAVREVLTSTELSRRLHAEEAARPGLLRRAAATLGCGLVSVARDCWNWLTTLVGQGRDKAAEAAAAFQRGRQTLAVSVRRGMSAFSRRLWLSGLVAAGLLRRFRRPILVATVSGLVIGFGCYLAGPAVASTVSGLAGFSASLAAGTLARLQQVLRRAAVQEWSVGRLP
jgi:hypothetical protein